MLRATCNTSLAGEPDQLDDRASLALALRALAAAPPVPLEALAAPLAPGTCLDEFVLLDVIGRGGMSVVYRARDKLLDRDVAVKVLNASWAPEVEPDEMLEREARATARLRHPSIVTIHRVGHHAGRLYLVLELLEGETLAARLDRGPVEQDGALAIGLQLLDALAHAHAQGIVHRDVKPGNVLVEPGGGIKVLDFGLSGLALGSPADGSRPARAGRVAGTPAYMAPELWRGEPADERTDVYSAGLVMQELMAGSSSARSRAGSWREPRLQPLKKLCPVRGQLNEIIARALAPDREDRFSDAGAMAAELRSVLAVARRWRISRRVGVGLLGLLLVSGALASGGRLLDRDPSVSDLGGSWQAEPNGFGRATLQRVDDGLYAWEQRKRPTRVGEDTFYNRGTLQLRREGGRILLSGALADEPGWCCGNVGFVELELTAPGELRVIKSLWGTRHGEYTTNHTPYTFRREVTAARREEDRGPPSTGRPWAVPGRPPSGSAVY